jgi:hypothetical protein
MANSGVGKGVLLTASSRMLAQPIVIRHFCRANPTCDAMTKAAALLLTLLMLLTACGGGTPMKPCPDPDPDPISPCATSHSKTYGGS